MLAETEPTADCVENIISDSAGSHLFVCLEPLQRYSLMVKMEQNVLFKTTGVKEQGGHLFFICMCLQGG